MKKFFVFINTLIISILIMTSPIYAWSSHGKMTYYVTYDIDWLNKFNDILITEYSYEDIDTELYNPDFKIIYKEGKIGEKTTALEILSIYSDEPDWDMDKNLKLSPFQKLTGGSSGWRHQYFITLFGLIRLGDGPKRAQYFYDLALKAFEKDDYYWGFRFFARALHHVEDLTQPFHTFPLPYSIVLKNIFDINGLVKIGENHHFAFEDYQETQIEIGRDDYIETLKSNETFSVKSIYQLAVKNAFRARKDSGKIYRIQEKFYGKEINSKKGFSINKEEYKTKKENEYQNDYDEIIKRNLSNFTKTVNTCLNLLYENLKNLNKIKD